MNYTEYEYFEMLSRDRNESADTFEKPANRKIWKGIVEKYSDQAHFIYELIQNADDAGVTFARFKLENDRLIFAHNGSRHFSISNPGTEDADFLDGKSQHNKRGLREKGDFTLFKKMSITVECGAHLHF